MIKNYLPKVYSESIFTIDYKKLKKKGITCLLFDVDNTICPAREEIFYEETKDLINKLKRDFKVILFSNNFPKRIKKFGDYYNVDIACLSLKPFPFKYISVLKKYNLKKTEVAAIGDQLLTDIKGGNSVGILTILVNPISHLDERETWLNRQIEKKIFKSFKEKDLLVKGRYYD